jgi:PAS domain S-box-containing protein
MPAASRQKFIATMVGCYALFAAVWVVLSDRLLAQFINIDNATQFATAKGLVFVAATSLLLAAALSATPNEVPAPDALGIRRRGRWRPLLAGLAPPLAAFAIQISLWQDFNPYVWFLFYPAVILASWLGRLAGGILATVFSTLLVWYFLIPVRQSFELESPYSAIPIGLFFAIGILVSFIHHRLRHTERLAGDAKFRALVEVSAIGIYIIQDNRFRYVNPAFAEIFGYGSPADLIGKVDVADVVSPADRPRVAENVRRRLNGEVAEMTYCFRGLRADGSRIDVEIHGRSYDHQGRPAVIGAALDITEKMRAEASLAASREHQRLFIEHSPAAIALFDRDMCYLEASRRWLEDYQLTDQNIIGQCHYSVFPEIGENWKEIHRRALAGQPSDNEEDAFLRADGTIQWLRWKVLPWALPDGTIGGVVIFSEDITSRKQAEDDQHRLSEALRQSAQGMIMTDMAGMITYANPAFLNLTGYRADQIIGTIVSDLAPSDETAARARAEMKRVTLGGDVWAAEVLRRAADGSWLPLYATVAAIRDGSGNPVGFCASYVDLRPLRESAKALENSETRYHLILDNAADAVFIADPQGCYRYVNRRAALLLGYTVDELLAMSIPDITPPEDAEHSADGFVELMSKGHLATELMLLRKDGSRVAVELNAILLPDGNAYGACRDITQRRAVEEELDRYRNRLEQVVLQQRGDAEALRSMVDKLSMLNAELERIAFVAAHDLREPVRAVSSYAQLLERRCLAKLDGVELEYLHYIGKGAMRAYELVGGLLDYSRLPIAATAPRLVPSDQACQGALNALAPEITETGATVTVDPLPVVMADDIQLIQVFQNMISNAIKFRHPDRALTIHVSASRADGDWLFNIDDNGIGFEPSEQDVFELFRQLGPRDKRVGIGAGLAICKRIVQRLGGRVWVVSRPGEGSSFGFSLPAESQPTQH